MIDKNRLISFDEASKRIANNIYDYLDLINYREMDDKIQKAIKDDIVYKYTGIDRRD